MSTATQPAASALLPLWTVTVAYDGGPMTDEIRAASPVEAIQTLAAMMALPVGALTEVHAVRA